MIRPLSSPAALALAWSLLFLATAGGPARAVAGPGDVGTMAADFNLLQYGGGSRSLSEHSGQVVMLFIMGYG